MDAKDIVAWAVIITIAVAVVAAACGWVMNIVTLIIGGDTMMTRELVMRFGGIFIAPVGAVLGYF